MTKCHNQTRCHQSDRKWMSFSLSFGCLSIPCGCCDVLTKCLPPLSSVTLERFEVDPAMIDAAHYDSALKVKSANTCIEVQSDRLLLPHSFRLSRVKIHFQPQLLSRSVSTGSVRFSLRPSDHLTPTLCSQSALLLHERHTSCSVCFDTSGKEL